MWVGCAVELRRSLTERGAGWRAALHQTHQKHVVLQLEGFRCFSVVETVLHGRSMPLAIAPSLRETDGAGRNAISLRDVEGMTSNNRPKA